MRKKYVLLEVKPHRFVYDEETDVHIGYDDAKTAEEVFCEAANLPELVDRLRYGIPKIGDTILVKKNNKYKLGVTKQEYNYDCLILDPEPEPEPDEWEKWADECPDEKFREFLGRIKEITDKLAESMAKK